MSRTILLFLIFLGLGNLALVLRLYVPANTGGTEQVLAVQDVTDEFEVPIESEETEATPSATISPMAAVSATASPEPVVPTPMAAFTYNEVKPTLTPLPDPTATPTLSPTPTIEPVTWDVHGLTEQYASVYGVDANVLRHVAECESGFNPAATHLDYAGLYQFSASTWVVYRQQMGENSDETLRLNAEEAIKTAAYVMSVGKTHLWPSCMP